MTDETTVTFFKPRGLFKKAVGTHVGDDGKARTTVWWLGKDRARAIEHVKLIQFAQTEFRKVGDIDQHWTPEAIARVKRGIARSDEVWAERVAIARETIAQAEASPTGPRPPEPPAAAAPLPAAKTLHDATRAYVESLDRKQVSDAHKMSARHMMARLRADWKDLPMSDVDYAWIDRMADTYKGRPENKRGKKMTATSVKTILKYIGAFFAWCDDVDYGGWQAPRKLAKPFRVVVADLQSQAERRKAATIEQFDAASLRRLYQSAPSDQVRSWMLAALFTGGTQFELAVMQRDEFDLDAGTLIHARNKTGVAGEFWVPPELVAMLRTAWQERESPLAFTTRDGLSVVGYANGRKRDAVRLAWNKLRIAAELPDALSFKYLRKYAADYAMQHGGLVMSQLALSHSPDSVAQRHYSSRKDFAQFKAIQMRMYDDLTAAGMFRPYTPEEVRAAERPAATEKVKPARAA